MRIGVPREVKLLESRVGLAPDSVRQLTERGHEVVVEAGAASRLGISDADYVAAGADIADSAQAVFAGAELIVKVKEPQPTEYGLLEPRHILFTYLHLAGMRELTDALCASGATAVAYETVTSGDGGLPLLKPMSEIAGRLAVHAGATCLQKSQGGSGVLISGATGLPPAKVLVLGGGTAGSNAAFIALGMQAAVTIVDRSADRLQQLRQRFGERLSTAVSGESVIAELAADADLVIGAVLLTGACAPKLITRQTVRRMRAGSVIVDIAIDQGGCCETSRPTTLAEPTFIVDEVVHYCVTNMPGDVPRTSTFALNKATLPYVLAIADHGWQAASAADSGLAKGLNVQDGKICHPAVAASFRT
jgi:alanine dehydrogenase